MAVKKNNTAIKNSTKHLLGIQNLSILEAKSILDEAKKFIELNRSSSKKLDALRGKTQINLFFEPSTRTQSSFDLAGKRLGADVMSMNMDNSALKKGETLIDTAMTLNAMHPDLIVIRHQDSGAPNLLSQKVNCAVINAGDGTHEHPTQAILDMMSLHEKFGKLKGLKVAIIGDILHSRVDLSNIHGLKTMGAEVILCGPPNLVPDHLKELEVTYSKDVDEVIEWADALNVLRIQRERMGRGLVPSTREYRSFFGITSERIKRHKKEIVIMHPGPMNRGVEIDG